MLSRRYRYIFNFHSIYFNPIILFLLELFKLNTTLIDAEIYLPNFLIDMFLKFFNDVLQKIFPLVFACVALFSFFITERNCRKNRNAGKVCNVKYLFVNYVHFHMDIDLLTDYAFDSRHRSPPLRVLILKNIAG